MGKPTAPAAPNPTQVNTQQTAADISTAVANSYIQNANETNPYGTVQYAADTTHPIQVPTGQTDRNGNPIYSTYDAPSFHRAVTLNPAQQGLLDQQNQLGSSLNNLAINQTNKVGDILGSPVSTAGLTPNALTPTTPTFGQVSGGPSANYITQGNVGPTGNIQTSFGSSGPIQNSIGPTDYSQQRSDVENAIYSRLNPQIDRDRSALETKLVNQGLVRGTAAFNTAMDENNRQANDARMQAVLAGGNEQSRLANLALQGGNFANAAQQQGYNQAAGRGAFANAGQQQQYDQNLGIAGFNNQAQATQGDFNNQVNLQNLQNYNNAIQTNNQTGQQGFANQIQAGNYQDTQRQQQLQEQLSLRNQPLNEISALMSGGQVTVPQFQNYNPGTVANSQLTNDIYGSAAINQQNYATKQSGTNALLGALGGLGGAGLYGLAKR